MADISALSAQKYAYWSKELAGLTVTQIDKLTAPMGVIGSRAWDTVRTERLNEERLASRKAKLLIMFPLTTAANFDALEIEDEPNDGGGLIVRLKAVSP